MTDYLFGATDPTPELLVIVVLIGAVLLVEGVVTVALWLKERKG